MKFIAPEVDIKKFDVADILTASSAAETEATTINQEGYPMEGQCVYNASDALVPECI